MEAQEKFLRFEGTTEDALAFVQDIHDLGTDVPNVLSDFVFNIECQLQREGVLDTNFNVIKKDEEEIDWDVPNVEGALWLPKEITYDATKLDSGWVLRPVGTVGTCGWINGLPWTVQYVMDKPDNIEERKE